MTSLLSGPIGPATDSAAVGRGERGCRVTGDTPCHTAVSPWPAAHRPVQSRDSSHYLFSRLLLNKCSLDSGEGGWGMGHRFV